MHAREACGMVGERDARSGLRYIHTSFDNRNTGKDSVRLLNNSVF